MKLVHFSNQPLEKIEYREQIERDGAYKPMGLWVSDEDEYGWKEWCKDEGFLLENLAFSYEIKLIDEPNVMVLETIEEIKDFSNRFYNKFYRMKDKLVKDRFSLDWDAVRKHYNGLIISPYQEELRLDNDHLWYYVWDCASGCIWEPNVIKSFERIERIER